VFSRVTNLENAVALVRFNIPPTGGRVVDLSERTATLLAYPMAVPRGWVQYVSGAAQWHNTRTLWLAQPGFVVRQGHTGSLSVDSDMIAAGTASTIYGAASRSRGSARPGR